MREWFEVEVRDGCKMPTYYSAPEGLDLEIIRRYQEDPWACVASTRSGKRCSLAHSRQATELPGGLLYCRVHADRFPHVSVQWGQGIEPCPCGCGYGVWTAWVRFFGAEEETAAPAS